VFGATAEDIERAKRPPPRVRGWLAVLLVVPFALVAALVWLVELVSTPEGVQWILDQATASAPFTLTVDDLEALPVGVWTDPGSWQVVVDGLAFAPRDPKKPSWRVTRARMGLPELVFTDDGIGLHFETLRVSGLAIEAHQQRPPPPWQPKEGGLALLSVGSVEILDASYYAPPDDPIGQAKLVGIRGSLRDLVWRPGVREVSAEGSLQVDEFVTGAISLTEVRLDPFRLARSNLHFEGDFRLGASRGVLAGDILTFHKKSDVTLDVQLDDADVGDVVETATGTRGPVEGRLDLSLIVYAGGDRPRGRSLLDGTVRLRDGRIQLGDQTKYIFLDLIRIAPWVKLDAYNRVMLEDLHGRIQFTRGTVELRKLSYPAAKRELRVDGTIERERLHLLVRLGPPPNRPDNPGIGIVLYGNTTEQRFRFATREDLTRPEPWKPIFTLDQTLPSVAPRDR
jgi:hypothetical protein